MKDVRQFFSNISLSWKTLWPSKIFRLHVLLTMFIFVAVGHYCALHFSIWETRRGTLLEDPLLNRLTPHDFSFPIFCILHSAFFISVFLNLDNPRELMKGFQAYTLLLIARTICIYFIPLERPTGMIYLDDPIIGLILNKVNVVTKDLFFSGHISSMCLFIYFSQKKWWRNYLMIATPVLAGLILWQHVHYTVDIIAAPFFAIVCCKLIDVLNERSEYGIDNRRWQYQ